MIKAIIFDVGGVLHTNELKYLREDIKKTLKISDEVFNKIYFDHLSLLRTGEIDEKEFWKRFVADSGTKEPLPKTSLFIREYSRRFTPNKDVLDLVKKLKKMKYKLAILSNTISRHVDYNQKIGTYDDFDIKVFSNLTGYAKPDLRIYEITLEKLKVKPEEAIFIDDIEANVDAAKRLGIKGIQFVSYEKLIKDLKKLKVV